MKIACLVSLNKIPSKKVAAKGKENISSVTSGKRRTTVTLLVTFSAKCSLIPSMFIFVRQKISRLFHSGRFY